MPAIGPPRRVGGSRCRKLSCRCPISDAELAAYRAYPDTFFGELRQPTRHAKTLVDWCDFFYETYKDTPRDKLLEWMAGASDIERLQTLSQEDLAIIICERWARNALQTGNVRRIMTTPN